MNFPTPPTPPAVRESATGAEEFFKQGTLSKSFGQIGGGIAEISKMRQYKRALAQGRKFMDQLYAEARSKEKGGFSDLEIKPPRMWSANDPHGYAQYVYEALLNRRKGEKVAGVLRGAAGGAQAGAQAGGAPGAAGAGAGPTAGPLPPTSPAETFLGYGRTPEQLRTMADLVGAGGLSPEETSKEMFKAMEAASKTTGKMYDTIRGLAEIQAEKNETELTVDGEPTISAETLPFAEVRFGKEREKQFAPSSGGRYGGGAGQPSTDSWKRAQDLTLAIGRLEIESVTGKKIGIAGEQGIRSITGTRDRLLLSDAFETFGMPYNQAQPLVNKLTQGIGVVWDPTGLPITPDGRLNIGSYDVQQMLFINGRKGMTNEDVKAAMKKWVGTTGLKGQ